MARYVVGVDFGTLSGRAVVVDVADGAERGSAVHAYRHGVITERLPSRRCRHRDDQVVRGVEGDQLAQGGPGQVEHRLPVATQHD
ncbi:hypothetical protein, partial [Micromonospora globispora]|uniref:hypothetical protein n=1 Tax=Micromonospora globispora TaxID=1450148 RepID=UPI000FB0449D